MTAPRLRTVLLAAFGGTYALALLVALLLHLELRRAAALSEEARLRSLSLQASISRYLQAMLNQEVGLRGYLASGDEKFLQPYELGQREVAEQMDALRAGVGDDQQDELRTLRDASRRWVREIAAPQIAARKAGPLPDLTDALGRGKARFDELRTAADALSVEVTRWTAANIEARERSLFYTRLGACLVVALLLLAGILTSRYVAQRTSLPLTALAEAADRETPFVLPPGHVHEVAQLGAALEGLRGRVVDREAALAQRRVEAEDLRAFGEVAQQCTDEAELDSVLERALRRALQPQALQILSRNASLNRLDVVLPPMAAAEQEKFPIVLDASRCRAVRSSGPVTLEASAPTACDCAFGVPQDGSYVCVPMLAAGEVIGLVNLKGPAGYATAARERIASMYVGPAAAALGTIRLLNLARERALRDGLTQAYNRRFVHDLLPKLAALALRNKRPLSAVMLDLDHFKKVNDTSGHEAGDRVLVAFTRTVQALIRSSDALVRYGGEEFLLVLPDTDHPGAVALAERIRAAAPSAGSAAAGARVTVSIGVATLPDHAGDLETLIGRADAALYRAKNTGRDRVVSAQLS